MAKYRIGIIGCGVICGSHLVSLTMLDNVEIIAVCDIIESRAKEKAEEYHCQYYLDYKKMISEENLDSVHICLPHYLHSEVTVYALNCGLDVLCEKPMDITLSAAEKMKEAAKLNNKKLGVIFQNRYTPGAVLIKNNINSGKLGTVKCISAQVIWFRGTEYYEHDSWRGKWKTEGGGVMINQAIHTLDLLRYFSGGDVTEVSAETSHRGETAIEVEDTSEGLIKFSNGARAIYYCTINNSFDSSVKLCVDCENGRAMLDGQSASIEFSNGETIHSDNNIDVVLPGKQCYGSGHFWQIREFYSENGAKKAEFTMNEALKTQALLEKIYNSSGVNRNI